MTPDDMTAEVKRMFMRLCDIDATVEDSLTILALLMGKTLATYAPDTATAMAWLEAHNTLAIAGREKLAAVYRRTGHPLAHRF